MKKTFLLLCTAATIVSCNARPAPRELPEQVTLTKERLLDKIKGGWAGQTIGCTYGGPTEFKFNGTMIQEYTPIPWPEHYIKWWYENTPGLYDDVYMDLTFVEVFDRLGIDAPVDSPMPATYCGTPTRPHATTSSTASGRPSRGTGSTTPMPTTSTSRSKPILRGSCPRACPTRPRSSATAWDTS